MEERKKKDINAVTNANENIDKQAVIKHVQKLKVNKDTAVKREKQKNKKRGKTGK